MSTEEDDELLQDFLIDAGEILEQLTEQVVDLEKSPDDREIINAVFRGFHTIKGGASFLALEPLVELCHKTEDVFNLLRNGERAVDSEVMDVVLPVLDVLKEQFNQLMSGESLVSADSELLSKLDVLSVPEGKRAPENIPLPRKKGGVNLSTTAGIPGTASPPILEHPKPTVMPGSDVTSKSEQQLLDRKARLCDSIDDEITQEEFESLLRRIEDGKKSKNSSEPFAGLPSTDDEDADKPVEPELQQLSSGPARYYSVDDDPEDDGIHDIEEITEEEFEALLDSFQGRSQTASTKAKTVTQTRQASASTANVQARYAETSGNNALAYRHSDSDSDVVLKEPPGNSSRQSSGVKGKPGANGKSRGRESQQGESTVRVDTRRLDDIMNMVGELVLVRNRMATLEVAANNEEMSKVVSNLDVVTADLQAAVMKTRMQPIKKVFGRFPRVVRDLARNLKKEVSLEMQGEETDLDKNLVEALADPLVHLVRNAVDHGIETPEEREVLKKPRKGVVVLTAEQEGDHILLTIQDDGRGMDADIIKERAIEKGILDPEIADRMENKDAYNLIFQPGFSTKEEISDISGRGVGMDVVKTRIEQLNGSVEIDSKKGHGSRVIIKVPLTLAIMPTLMVMLEKQIFALPLASVNEIFHLDLTRTNIVDGQLVVMVREKALPLFYLRHWLVRGASSQPLPDEGHVVVVSMGVQRIGFVVDQLIGQEEVVIKPLGALLHGMKGLAGATITGDGRISLILDIPGLMQTYARRL